MSEEKRKRSPNWLKSEKELLINIVERHFNIIENKKIDGASIKAKLAQWQVIADQYNSRTTNCARTAENLKSQWECMKKAARKDAANNRRLIETGGSPPPKRDPLLQRILSLLTNSGVGITNTFDSDSQDVQILNTHFPDPLSMQNEDMPIITVKDQMSDSDAICDDDNDDEDEQENYKEDWVYTPPVLPPPLLPSPVPSPPVSRSTKPNKPQTCFTRKRRIHTTTTYSMHQVHKKKIEALELQMKLAMEEMQRSKSLHEIEMQIKMEKLQQEKINSNILLIRQRKLIRTLSTKEQ